MYIQLEKVSKHLVTALIVVSLFETGAIVKIRADSARYGSGTRFEMSTASLRDSAIAVTQPSTCSLLRVSSDGCPYCRLDNVFYLELVKRVGTAGCRSFLVPPKAGQVAKSGVPSGTTLLEHVDMAFGQTLYPFSTPQTILLDGSGNVVWFRDGALDNHSLAEGLRAVERVR